MVSVTIARLKARLSEYLRLARSGRSITVLNRDTPIARIVPLSGETGTLRVRHPAENAPAPGRVDLPPPLPLPIDVVELLREERRSER